MVGYYHSNDLPWTKLPEDQGRLHKITQIVLAVFLVIGAILPTIPVPERDRYQSESIPPRLAKLIVEKQLPKPVPKVEEPKVEKKEEAKKEEKKPEPKKEEVKKEEPSPEALAAKAREKASRSGLLALADELQDLRDTPEVPQVNLNMSARQQESKTAAPDLLTMSTASSGGINTSNLARAASRTRQLSARDTEQVESPVAKAAQEGRDTPRQHLKGPRTLEQISLVMERYKGALTRLHNIALRKNPSIEGKVVLEMAIAAEGNVTGCKVLSADFSDEDFLGKVVAKCRSFDFGPANTDMTINFPFDFIPLS